MKYVALLYGEPDAGPLDHWFAVIDASGLTKHNEVVTMLKADPRARARRCAPRVAACPATRG